MTEAHTYAAAAVGGHVLDNQWLPLGRVGQRVGGVGGLKQRVVLHSPTPTISPSSALTHCCECTAGQQADAVLESPRMAAQLIRTLRSAGLTLQPWHAT